MGCFHCGKSISWLRRRSDADFCSDEHRRRYLLAMRAALARIAETPVQGGVRALEEPALAA